MALKEIDTPWTVTTERFVAYIDIMGFKDMVARLSHAEVYEMMKQIDESKKLAESTAWSKRSNLVSTTNYSDSIMIYSKDASLESYHSFACSVASITGDLFRAGIPHKGGFAFGTMTLDIANSIFFGQPLIDAYLLQEEVYFYGIVGHGSAEKQLMDIKPQIFTYKYPCVFKNGTSDHLIICPMYAQHDGGAEFLKEHKELLESVNKLRHRTSGSLRKYIDNTEKYLKIIGSFP